MAPHEFDLVIIGAGSAGLTAAGFAAQLGAKVALVEKNRIGGDCTWTGCVPSKALLKAARMGGLSAGIATHDLCQQARIPVWCGGLLETGIGRAANLALASLPNFILPADLSASARYFHEDLIDPPVTLNPGGTITVPNEPGLGFRVLEDRVNRYTRRQASFPK